MEVRSTVAVIQFLCFFLMLNSTAQAYEIEGRLRLAPPWPKRDSIPVKKDVMTCGDSQRSQTLMISDDGFLQNAVVSLESERLADSDQKLELQTKPFLNQKDCHFTPHILLVPQSDSFLVGNEDPMAHDVRAFQGSHMLFRFEMDAHSSPVEKKLNQTGRFVIRCGLHSWMHAYVISTEHPFYAVSDSGGKFKLEAVPAGSFELKIWHEVLGEVRIPLTVSESIPDFSYTFPSVSDEQMNLGTRLETNPMKQGGKQ